MPTNLARDVEEFTSNAYLVTGERTVLIDAGANFDVVERVRGAGADPDAVLITHAHPDHVGNVESLRAAFGVETWGYDTGSGSVDNALRDDETVRLGDGEYRTLHTPGHAADHLCLYSSEERALFAGDLAFANGAFGRTDLPGADRDTLVSSLDRVLATVGEDLAALYPGHGPSVTERPYDDLAYAARAARMR